MIDTPQKYIPPIRVERTKKQLTLLSPFLAWGKSKHQMDRNIIGRGELPSCPVKMIASLKNEGIWKKVSCYSAGYLFYLTGSYPHKMT